MADYMHDKYGGQHLARDRDLDLDRNRDRDRYSTQYHGQQNPRTTQMVKAATAATAGGSLLLMSGLTLTGTVIALVVATPLLVIFSPVLVPAAITVFMITAGFLTSGVSGMTGIAVLAWIYRFMTGQRPVGADQLERAQNKLAGKARDIKDTAQDYGHRATSGGTHYTGGVTGGAHHTTTTGVHQTSATA